MLCAKNKVSYMKNTKSKILNLRVMQDALDLEVQQIQSMINLFKKSAILF